MIKHTYEIGENNAVSIFAEGQEDPSIFQPTWPDGTSWASAEEASEWAQTYASSLEDPDYEFIVGLSPDEPKLPKPTPPAMPEAPAE